MAFLDWIKQRREANNAPRHDATQGSKVFLGYGERAALNRLVQHYDDGLIGWKGGKAPAWEKDVNAVSGRLGFRDPFGDRAVQLSEKEANAIGELHRACERDADAFVVTSQVVTDIKSVGKALRKDGRPHEPEGPTPPKRERGKGHDIPF